MRPRSALPFAFTFACGQPGAGLGGAITSDAELPSHILVAVERVKVPLTLDSRDFHEARWDRSVEDDGDDAGCALLAALASFASDFAGDATGSFCSLLSKKPGTEKQFENPDLFVEFKFGDVVYRTSVRPNEPYYRSDHMLVVPREAVQNGFRVDVLDFEGPNDEPQLAGTVDVPRSSIKIGEKITVSDGYLEALDLRFAEVGSLPSTTLRLDVSDGVVHLPGVDLPAGIVLEIRASGTYTIGSSYDTPIGPEGYPDTGPSDYNLEANEFRSAPHGGAIAIIRRGGLAQGSVVGSCSRFVTTGGGKVLLGVNDEAPGNNKGEIGFTLSASVPTIEEWSRPAQVRGCHSN